MSDRPVALAHMTLPVVVVWTLCGLACWCVLAALAFGVYVLVERVA